MKGKLLIALFPAMLFYASSCQQKVGSIDLKTDHDTVSYLFGHNIGTSLAASPITELNFNALTKGLQDGLDGEELFVDDITANMIVTQYMQRIEDEVAFKNLDEGLAFLENNKTRAGVITTESGLQYEVLIEGTGPRPTDTSTVEVHYHGTLIDGTVFESSVEHGQPATCSLNQVISGWTEVLQLMPVGSKWKVFLPSELAYGDSPRPGGLIQSNMVLIFEIELISILN